MEGDDEPEDDGGETDHGVPFPGTVVAAERRTEAHATLPRGAPVPWGPLFGRADAPRVVDLGCGNGRFLLGSALRRPERDHLGVDLVPHAIRHAARRAGERGLANVKYAWGDGLDLLFQGLEPESVDELHVYHPQPYYDASKAGKRMLTPAFFGRAWTVLKKPDGMLTLQTDNPYYWRYVSKVAPRLFRWLEHPEPWPDAPEGRTRREVFARARGLTIFRGVGVPRAMSQHRVRQVVRHLPAATFDANRPKFRGDVGDRK
jgi:tRNA (guanine-N7-)-methyltransferase